MNTTDNMPAVLLIATFDTKAGEALYLQRKIESLGCRVLSMDTGILQESGKVTDINRHQVAKAGGSSIQEMVASGDKGKCIRAMRKGACVLSRKLYDAGRVPGRHFDRRRAGDRYRDRDDAGGERVVDLFNGFIPENVANPEVISFERWKYLRKK